MAIELTTATNEQLSGIRSALQVGSESSVVFSNVTASNNITANKFFGDGSNLTDVRSTEVALLCSVTTDLELGALSASSVITAGTSFQEFVEKLLTKTFFPTFSVPTGSLSITVNSVTNPIDVEVGSQGVTFTATLNKGSINGALSNGIWIPSAFQNFRSGDATNYTINGIDNDTSNQLVSALGVINEGSNFFTSSIDYAQGPQPLDSKNQSFSTALSAGTVTGGNLNRTINGRRRIFYGADTFNTQPSSVNVIRSLPQNFLNPTNGLQFTVANGRALTIPAGSNRVVIAYPSALQEVSTIRYVEAGNANVISTFAQTISSIPGLNNHQPVNYRVYVYRPSVPFPSPATYEIII